MSMYWQGTSPLDQILASHPRSAITQSFLGNGRQLHVANACRLFRTSHKFPILELIRNRLHRLALRSNRQGTHAQLTTAPSTIESKAMNHIPLSDVQYINLNALTAIKMGILQDRVATCCRFALNAAQADFLVNLSVDQIWAIVANVGPATLFPPRQDLLRLLQTPLPLVGPLAAAQSPKAQTA